MADELCELSELPKNQCAHCRNETLDDSDDDSKISFKGLLDVRSS